ncbi:monovalent cation/H+ antiporter complex subunit F [Georgenia sp. Z1491]|uniref:monovalent cation/H+ antiporter complex subunit F n=1 Tax=Georgenia sp. Z1491 TaxID=3416707 RepID=UPI003CE9A71D
MTGIVIAIVIVGVTALVATYRMLVGPSDADRAVGADLLTFGVIGLVVLGGVLTAMTYAFDLLLVVALVAFLSAISLGRALTRGQR